MENRSPSNQNQRPGSGAGFADKREMGLLQRRMNNIYLNGKRQAVTSEGIQLRTSEDVETYEANGKRYFRINGVFSMMRGLGTYGNGLIDETLIFDTIDSGISQIFIFIDFEYTSDGNLDETWITRARFAIYPVPADVGDYVTDAVTLSRYSKRTDLRGASGIEWNSSRGLPLIGAYHVNSGVFDPVNYAQAREFAPRRHHTRMFYQRGTSEVKIQYFYAADGLHQRLYDGVGVLVAVPVSTDKYVWLQQPSPTANWTLVLHGSKTTPPDATKSSMCVGRIKTDSVGDLLEFEDYTGLSVLPISGANTSFTIDSTTYTVRNGLIMGTS